MLNERVRTMVLTLGPLAEGILPFQGVYCQHLCRVIRLASGTSLNGKTMLPPL